MKADQETHPVVAVAQPQPAQPFRQLLERAAATGTKVPTPLVSAGATPLMAALPKPRPSAGVASRSTPIARITLTSASAADVARAARGRVDAEARRLEEVRGDHQARASEATANRHSEITALKLHRKERLVELITSELVAAFDDGSTTAANDLPSKAVIPPTSPTDASTAKTQGPSTAELQKASGERAAQAVALIERIELFVKAAKRPALELTLNNSLGARVEIERLGPGEVAIKLVGQRGPPSPDTVSRIRDELRARGLKVAAMSVA